MIIENTTALEKSPKRLSFLKTMCTHTLTATAITELKQNLPDVFIGEQSNLDNLSKEMGECINYGREKTVGEKTMALLQSVASGY